MSYTQWMFLRVDRCNEWSATRSVLGPLLFVIYINDIDDCVAGRILKFADDTKIYRTLASVDDVSALQSDLSDLVAWSIEWKMLF